MRLHLPIIPLLALAACTRPEPARGSDPPRADSATQPAPTPLAKARSLPPGTTLTAAGVVTVASGVVDAGFAMQDGPQGIYVAADSTTLLRAGQMVRVTGRLADQHGLLTLVPGRVEVTGQTAPFPAISIRTKRVGEVTESLLVDVRGRITAPVVDDRPYGWKIMIDDGSGPRQLFVPAHHPFDAAQYQPGKRLEAQGMSAQYDSTYEVIATQPLRIVP